MNARFVSCFAAQVGWWGVAAASCGVAFAQPLANLSRAGIEWGIVSAGFPNDTQPVFVTNTGNAPLTLRRLAVTENAGAPFAISGTCQPGTVLPAGGRCRVDIDLYLANLLDPAEAMLTLESDGAPERVDVALHASSVGTSHPEFRAPNFTPDWIEFAPQALGSPAAHRTATLRNDSALPWRVRKLTLVGGDSTDFTLATDCIGSTLRMGDVCTVNIGFVPTAAGPRSTQLLLEFHESASTFRSITGVGGQVGEGEKLPLDSDRPSARRAGELGVNLFGFSIHADRSEGHNEVNPGVGLRYVFSEPAPRWALFGEASIYYDSNREWAKYVALGTSYRFAGAWSVGAAVAYVQSPSYNNGKPFFAVVPGLAFEYRKVAINAVLLPSENADSKISGLAFYATIPLNRND